MEPLVARLGDCSVLADKGFVDQARAQRLQERQGMALLTPKRTGQKQQAPLQRYVVNSFQPPVDTVFAQLTNHMHLSEGVTW